MLEDWEWGLDGLTFSQWFEKEGFSEEQREVLAKTWNAAIHNAQREIDNESVLDRLCD